MKLLKKQLFTQLFKDKIFIVLMFLLTIFTSFMYFFVHFSIDGNMKNLNALPTLSEQQLAYQNALTSNTSLARSFLLASIPLTGFVFYMFFSRFLKKNSKQIGCLKALGFKDCTIHLALIQFSLYLSLLGSITALVLGYFASDLLLQANMRSYSVTHLVKSIHLYTFLIGSIMPTAIFCWITALTYYATKKIEVAYLLSPRTDTCTYPAVLRLAHQIATFLPIKNKLSTRLALRKPIALFLILVAVTTVSIMFTLGYSLNLSSQKLYDSQTLGYHYKYDTDFGSPHTLKSIPADSMPYLKATALLKMSDLTLDQQVISFENNSPLFDLLDSNGHALLVPRPGEIIISPMLQDLYNIQLGDTLTLSINNRSQNFIVSQIAFNATLNSIYIAPSDLESLLSLPSQSYTGIWSMTPLSNAYATTSQSQRLLALEKNSVSNQTSALINQVVACLIGCILLFLALLLNFQDYTRDMLILNLMGYPSSEIRKTLIDLYKPILWLFFLLTLWPSIQIVKSILKSLSLQTGDYFAFQTNGFVIIGIFIILNIIYMLVQVSFNVGIKKIIKTDTLYTYTSNE
ncbi:MAG: hypothetical protein J6F30_02960 [Cellulosilyticum sp.]|nr:hypothetical protein [Cellulosilyticum sp.]